MSRRIRGHSPRRDPNDEPERFRKALRGANLPERYWNAAPEAIKERGTREWVEMALANAPTWLSAGEGFYLHGRLNAGKSSIAAIFLMDAVRRVERCLWLPVRDVPAVVFREGERGPELNELMRTADLLVIDDLGSERFKTKSAAGTALEETLRTVYDRGRSLIVTGNMAWNDLPTRYGVDDPLLSVLRRLVKPQKIDGDQWPLAPMAGTP